MTNLSLLMTCFFLIATGCTKPSFKTFSEEKMRDVMLDVTMADQVVNLYSPEDRDSIRELLTQSLLKIHNISESDLDSNLYLYMSDFKKFGDLTDQMLLRYDTISKKFE